MPKLVARGPGGEEKRCRLRPERPVRLGRRPGADDPAADPFEVPWEGKLSRNQADLRWARGRLEVERLPEAKNPLFFKGQETTSFSMALGEHFVVGETTFTLSEDRVSVASDDDLVAGAEVMAAIGTSEVSIDKETRRLALPVNTGAEALVHTVRALDARGITPLDLALRRPTLDDVFLALTGHPAEEEERAE